MGEESPVRPMFALCWRVRPPGGRMPEQLAMLATVLLIAALWAALTRVLRSGLVRERPRDPARAVTSNRHKRASTLWSPQSRDETNGDRTLPQLPG